MSRVAVKGYIKQQMALLDIPVETYVLDQRPKQFASASECALIIVEDPSVKEDRFTVPRGPGTKRVVHQCRLLLFWLAANEQTGGHAFDALLEQIDNIFRTLTIPIAITDPDTGVGSNILLIGEEIVTDVGEPVLDQSSEGMIVFSAQKMLAVTELITG